VVWVYIYSFILVFYSFFYEGQMMIYVFFQYTNSLGNFSHGQGVALEFLDDRLTYGLFSFIRHNIYFFIAVMKSKIPLPTRIL